MTSNYLMLEEEDSPDFWANSLMVKARVRGNAVQGEWHYPGKEAALDSGPAPCRQKLFHCSLSNEYYMQSEEIH